MALSRDYIGKKIIYFPELDSTNSYLKKHCLENPFLEHGYTVHAGFQTQGRGQNNHQWKSNRNANILMSCYVKTSFLNISDIFLLHCFATSGIVSFLRNYGLKEVSTKWVNDIYFNHKKIGGILIDNILRGQKLQSSIIGIGLNINQKTFSTDIANATSLSIEYGKKLNIEKLTTELCSCLNKAFEILKKHPSQLVDDYNSNLYLKGLKGFFKAKDNTIFEATILEVLKNGSIKLKLNNIIKNYTFEEIKLLSHG